MNEIGSEFSIVRRVPLLVGTPSHRAQLLFASEASVEDHVNGIQINLRINSDPSVETSRAEQNDPSTIYLNSEINDTVGSVTEPLGYFPSYAGMTPEQRAVYLRWLCDITQTVDIGYVFVYYYGLERHLAYGDFDKAVDEILLLRLHHRNGSFLSYSGSALLHACLIRKRIDTLEELYKLRNYNYFDNSNLLLLYSVGKQLSVDVLIQLANRLPGINRRYLRQEPDLYRKAIGDLLKRRFGTDEYPFSSRFSLDDVQKTSYPLFANTSLPSEIRSPRLPNLLHHAPFVSELKEFFKTVHEEMKYEKRTNRKSISGVVRRDLT